MKLLIFEPTTQGHRLHYVATMAPGLLAAGDVTVATTAGARNTDEYRAHLSPLESRLQVDAWMPLASLSGARFWRSQVTYLRESIRRVQPDRVYIPYVDGLAQILGTSRLLWRSIVPRNVSVEALMLGGPLARPALTGFKGAKARVAWHFATRPPWASFFSIHPLVYERVNAAGGSLSMLPDPETPAALTRVEMLSHFGLPADGRYIGIAGVLDKRKGVDLLLRAFSIAKLSETDRLLLIGRLHPDIRHLLDGEYGGLIKSGRIQCVDRLVSTEEFSSGIAAMDLVCLPYPAQLGSVSIAIRAAAAGRPVLGSNFGWLEYVVPRFGLGSTTNVMDAANFAISLASSLDEAHTFQLSEIGKRYVKFHTPENFRAIWAGGVNEALGRPASSESVSWRWVLGES